jgi:hypothetical protein
MATEYPIVRIFFTKMKSEFFELSEDERVAFMAKDRANLDELGMKAISMVDCRKNDDGWDYIGVEGWPSLEAIKERERFESDELQIHKYVEYETHIGVEQAFDNYGKS